jgi:hypothetical protein
MHQAKIRRAIATVARDEGAIGIGVEGNFGRKRSPSAVWKKEGSTGLTNVICNAL